MSAVGVPRGRRFRLPMMLCAATLAALLWRGGLAVSAADRVDADTHATPIAAKAAAVLETHCARCHQAGRLTSDGKPNLFRNILDLEAIARDPSLVRPGLPDGSPLYTAMLRRSMPPDRQGDDGAWTGPTADDVQAVRDWIDALPVRASGTCSRGPASGEKTAPSRSDSTTATDTRFITLGHFDAVCAGTREMEQHRNALRRLIAHLSRRQPGATPEPVDTGRTLFRVSLNALGWSAAEWDQLGGNDPLDRLFRVSQGFDLAVRGDWLAHAVLRSGMPLEGLAADEDGSIATIARAWERPLDLDTAAAEMGMDRESLARLLESAPAPAVVLARRLLQDLLPRSELLALRAALSGTPVSDPPAHQADGAQKLELAIWSDKPAYSKGELLTLHAWSTIDCHLTLIGLDRGGRATVLFPNEMEPDNLLTAGRVLTVPGAEAAYQFRLADEGRERVVGVCTVSAGLADGIQPDYERQRFTLLGDWRQFLARAWAETGTAPRGGGKRRDAKTKVERPSPEHHARTAIMFEVR